MSKQRYINTKIWEDAWFSSLDQIEQLVFIYFLTNPMTNIIGAYELSKGTISRAVGLEIMTLDAILKRFERDNKISYIDGWVVIHNFIKHQNFKSPSIQKGIEIQLLEVPDEIKTLIQTPSPHRPHTLSHLNTNLNSNSNIKVKPKDAPKNGADEEKPQKKVYNPLGADIIKAFEEIDIKNKRHYGNKTQREACDFLIQEYGFEKVMELIPKLKITNTQSVWQITTPWEMVEKISKVFNDVKRKEVENYKGRGIA